MHDKEELKKLLRESIASGMSVVPIDQLDSKTQAYRAGISFGLGMACQLIQSMDDGDVQKLFDCVMEL